MLLSRLLRLALVGEGALALAAGAWTSLRRLPVGWGPVGTGLAGGVGTAALFVLANYYLLRHAPAVPPVRSLRRLHRAVLRPVFASVRARDVVALSLAAGLGEELLFRGAVQSELGLLPASLLFGALHLGGSGTFAFGCWAALLGLVLGWLALATGGLLAPVLAHALYDAVAIAYIAWAPAPADRGMVD